jgi:dTDP-glucose 4,6-dehydratase
MEEIIKIADSEKPVIIGNFAAQGEVRNSWKYPEQWYQTNCMAMVRLTDKLRRRDYIEKYVTSSTPEVYGSSEKNLVENHNYFPSTPYAASKLAGDLHLFTLFKHYQFPVVFTRSANVYGIHQQLYRIIPRTIIYLKLGKIIELHGHGRAVRSFVHIRDVVDATLRVAENGRTGDIYHISKQKEEISIKSLVELICSMMNHDFNDSVKLIDENYGQDAIYSLNSDKLRSELGWKPNVSLKEGIQEMIIWVDDNWDMIQSMPLKYVHKE